MTTERKILRRPAAASQLGFRVTTGRDTEKARIAKLLGLDEKQDGLWDIRERVGDLRLIHYQMPLPEVVRLRGLIVELSPTGDRVIATPQSYFPTAVAARLPAEGPLTFTEVDGAYLPTDVKHVLPRTSLDIVPALDKTIVRIYWYKDSAYMATARKPDAWELTYGPSPTFGALFETLGGPSVEELYPDEESCEWVYEFALVSPHFALGMRLRTPGFLIFQGRENRTTGERKMTIPGDYELKPATIQNMPELGPGVYVLSPLTLSEATDFLVHGFGECDRKGDERLWPGEAINIEHTNEKGQVTRLRVCSPGYAWRARMRGDQSDGMRALYAAYGKLVALDQKAWAELPRLGEAKKREELAADVLALAFPFPLADKIHAVARDLPRHRAEITAWLVKLAANDTFRKYKFDCERVTQIIKGAYGYAIKDVPTGPKGTAANEFIAARNRHLAQFVESERTEGIFRLLNEKKRHDA